MRVFLWGKIGIIRFIAGSSNGRTIASEVIYLGPNPSPAANTDYNPKCSIQPTKHPEISLIFMKTGLNIRILSYSAVKRPKIASYNDITVLDRFYRKHS